ncbi:MAG TPA: hypothetical protein VGD27_10835 [Longimicrobiales bacterium]
MKTSAVLLAAVLFSTSTAFAQERGLSRRQFPFFDNKLTVEIVADMPGQLQLVRGEPGMIEVAARVPGGIPAFALGGREGDRLRLTAVGGDHADFVLIIPEDAMVRVLLPDRNSHQVNSMQKSGRYNWGEMTKGSGPVESTETTALAYAPSAPATAYSNVMTPRAVNVSRLNAVRTVSVRFEGSTFNVAGTQPMSVQDGDPSNIEIRTGEEVQDVVISLPLGTSAFALRLGGKSAMQVVGGEIRVYCEPLTEQDLGAGRRWYTFTPSMGRLTCR